MADYIAQDPDAVSRKERIFNKPGTFLYKIHDDYRYILRIVPGYPQGNYFIVQKMMYSAGYHKTWPQTLWKMDTHTIRDKYETFLELLLLYHNTNLCHITPIILNRIGLSKAELENYLAASKHNEKNWTVPFESSPFLKFTYRKAMGPLVFGMSSCFRLRQANFTKR